MAALLLYVTLMLWAAVAWAVHGPSEADVQRTCTGHGKVVSYTGTDVWAVDAGPRVVCSDGAVRYVK